MLGRQRVKGARTLPDTRCSSASLRGAVRRVFFYLIGSLLQKLTFGGERVVAPPGSPPERSAPGEEGSAAGPGRAGDGPGPSSARM